MGRLVDGEWKDVWYDTDSTGGKFERQEASFRNWITPDGAAGPTGRGGYAAQAGRYHLYVSYACPWAHRTLAVRVLEGLEDMIEVSAVHPDMLGEGWTFDTDFPGATGDRLHGLDYARQLYLRDTPDVTTRVTVPILWDTDTGTIVSNESSEIVRMFDTAFDALKGPGPDLRPEPLAERIDEINARVYDTVNNGVYKAGFATTQDAYEAAVGPLFDSLDWLEGLLGRHRYLTGDAATEADWRLWTTLMRFDAVYHGHFKCNRAKLIEYPNLWGFTRDLYQTPGIAQTVRMDHIVRHYHYSHETINPHRIVPVGPDLDFDAPHGRG
ncbi:MAG: glutathione S-transferase family protein [Paracoccaceae bacterium]